MFNKTEQNLSLMDRQSRYALAVRIGMVLLAFFSAAWCMLQWTLTSEPRFMAEGITRQFVVVEAIACAVAAVAACLFMIANGLGWIVTVIRLHREQSSAMRKLAMKRSARRVGAYV